jgi:hypothetical protein
MINNAWLLPGFSQWEPVMVPAASGELHMTLIRLTDLQRVLLTAACYRADGSLMPPPASAGDDRSGIDKAVAQLIKRGLVEEKEALSPDLAWREDEGRPLGAFVTGMAREHLGIAAPQPQPEHAAVADAIARPSKTQAVLALLQRPEGATLADIVAATGWLPHSSRAALTGLRKKGHAIVRTTADDVTCYRIGAAG